MQIDVATGTKESYSDVNKKLIRVALNMKHFGIKNCGDVIAVCSENSLDCILPIFGGIYNNTVVSCLDPSISLRDTVYLLNVVRPKVIFIQSASLSLIEEAINRLDFKIDIVDMNSTSSYVGFEKFLEANEWESTFQPEPVHDVNDTKLILFSSGTTGMPKGICCTDYGIMGNIMSGA